MTKSFDWNIRLAQKSSAFSAQNFFSRKNPRFFPAITTNYAVRRIFDAVLANLTDLRISESKQWIVNSMEHIKSEKVEKVKSEKAFQLQLKPTFSHFTFKLFHFLIFVNWTLFDEFLATQTVTRPRNRGEPFRVNFFFTIQTNTVFVVSDSHQRFVNHF